MRLVEQSAKLWQQEDGYEGMLRHIERCGRVAYKSEMSDNVEDTKKFVKNLIDDGHYAVLEHGTVYLAYKTKWTGDRFTNKYDNNPYSYICGYDCPGSDKTPDGWVQRMFYITTNYRVLVENNWLEDMKYLCEPTKYHLPRITFKLTTNIGVTREGNRMRANSITEESTRYCNYTKDKFGKEITFTAPVWLSPEQRGNFNAGNVYMGARQLLECGNYKPEEYSELVYLSAIAYAELHYNTLIRLGWTPQQAREVLPLATKSEVVYTAFLYQWKHFFDLRLYGKTGKPHPNMVILAQKIKDEFERNGITI
jgi:thymidylate synthase (FAD)